MDERMKNLLLFKAYATDDQLEAAAPWAVAIIVLCIIGFALYTWLR